MDVALAEFLVSDVGAAEVSQAEGLLVQKIDTIVGISRLRKRLTAEQAGVVWKAAQLRQRAAEKLGDVARELLLDQDGYEMSSGWVASLYHSEIMSHASVRTIIDLCAGLGLDSIAFAKADIAVTAYESDPGRAALLAGNIRQLGLDDRVTVVTADVTAAELPVADAAFFDPARRAGARRWVNDDEMTTPSLSFIRSVIGSGIKNVAVKLSPAVDRGVAESYAGSLQFVSVNGECKEALLLLGELKTDYEFEAVLLPDNYRFHGSSEAVISELHGAYIWEPDAAVIRAGLTGALATSLGGWQCDNHVDYFFSDNAGLTPFAVCYRVLVDIPYSRRGLQEALNGVGKVILKQRAFPMSIEEVQQKLKLSPGPKVSTVILTTFNGENFALVVERVGKHESEGSAR